MLFLISVCDQFEKFRGDRTENCFSDMIRLLFTAFMECDNEIALNQIKILTTRIKAELMTSESILVLDQQRNIKRKTRENSIGYDIYEMNTDDISMRHLILHLHVDYPGDLGCLCPLLLNCLNLSEGEAFFMGSNEPHAYISGKMR